VLLSSGTLRIKAALEVLRQFPVAGKRDLENDPTAAIGHTRGLWHTGRQRRSRLVAHESVEAIKNRSMNKVGRAKPVLSRGSLGPLRVHWGLIGGAGNILAE